MFNCDDSYMRDQGLNIKAYLKHNLREMRETLIVGDGNMVFSLYVWQTSLEVIFPDFRALVKEGSAYHRLLRDRSAISVPGGNHDGNWQPASIVPPLSSGVANPDGFANPWFRSGLEPNSMRAPQESIGTLSI